MRSRKDYAKEFELVVQQEIKNYNDTVYLTNVSIESAKKSFLDLSKETNQKFSVLENKFVSQNIEISRIKEALENLNTKLMNRLGDQEGKIQQFSDHLRASVTEFQSDYLEKEEFSQLVDRINGEIDEIFIQINKLKDSFIQEINRSRHESINELDNLKKDLNEKPSEVDPLKRELEKKIEIASVDTAGVMREIAIVKKSILITEKQIENIYTLIERVNKRISS